MKIKPEELSDAGYILIDELDHKDLVPFIRKYLKKINKFSILYYLSNTLLFGLTGYCLFTDFSQEGLDFENRFTHLAYGIAAAFALLPLHEYIHVVAYKTQGAANTSYYAELRKFYFLALAHDFVANRREFQVVALAPFVLISSLLTLFLFFVPFEWKLTILGTLLTHTAMCSGDFGLLSYFEFNKTKQIVTYDDVKNKVSYFYQLE